MNITTNFFKDIYDFFKDNKKINKEKIINDMPDNLKSPPKLKLLELLPEELTVSNFINLLMTQTYGGDYVNFDAIQKLSKLDIDTNHNIIFNNTIMYRNIKKEPYVIWLIVTYIKNHSFLSKYADTLLHLSLEKKLELSIIANKSNFRYDCCFEAINVAVECDENHHFGSKQIALDVEKSALMSLHGKNLVRFVTNEFDQLREVRRTIKNSTIAEVKNSTIDFVETLCKLKSVKKYSSIKNLKQILQNRIIYQIHTHFAQAQTPTCEEKNDTFKLAFDNSTRANINMYISTMLQNYVEPLIDDGIHAHIKDSQYLKDFNVELTNIILNAALLNYEFRVDYIKIIFQESLYDMYSDKIFYIESINVNITECIDKCSNLQLLVNDFILDSKDFNKIFAIKRKSLQNLNNPNIITIEEVASILATDYTNNEFVMFIKDTCNIHDNKEILISWRMLNKVLLAYNEYPQIKNLMLLYYSELDTIYENIFNRISTHTTACSGSEAKYNTYMQRLNKYFNVEQAMQELTLQETPIKLITLYNTYDVEYLQRTNIAQRVQILNFKFDNIKLNQEPEPIHYLSDDEPQSDSDVE